MSCALGTGRGRSKTELTIAKIATFAAIHAASVMITPAANPLPLISARAASLTSCSSFSMRSPLRQQDVDQITIAFRLPPVVFSISLKKLGNSGAGLPGTHRNCPYLMPVVRPWTGSAWDGWREAPSVEWWSLRSNGAEEGRGPAVVMAGGQDQQRVPTRQVGHRCRLAQASARFRLRIASS